MWQKLVSMLLLGQKDTKLRDKIIRLLFDRCKFLYGRDRDIDDALQLLNKMLLACVIEGGMEDKFLVLFKLATIPGQDLFPFHCLLLSQDLLRKDDYDLKEELRKQKKILYEKEAEKKITSDWIVKNIGWIKFRRGTRINSSYPQFDKVVEKKWKVTRPAVEDNSAFERLSDYLVAFLKVVGMPFLWTYLPSLITKLLLEHRKKGYMSEVELKAVLDPSVSAIGASFLLAEKSSVLNIKRYFNPDCTDVDLLKTRDEMAQTNKNRIEEKGKPPGSTVYVAGPVLRGLGTLEFLKILIASSSTHFMDVDALGIVVDALWIKHIRKYFLLEFWLFMVLCVCWLSLQFLHMQEVSFAKTSPLRMVILVIDLVLFVKEFLQLRFNNYNFRSHFKDGWNIVDVSVLLLVLFHLVTLFMYDHHPEARGVPNLKTIVSVFTSIFLTIKLLSYIRAFPSSGWLISVLIQNTKDMMPFLTVMLIILIGFTSVFAELVHSFKWTCTGGIDDDETQCEKDPGRARQALYSFFVAFLKTFNIGIMGDFDSSDYSSSGSTVPWLANLNHVLVCLAVPVVSLNALIALLGDSYESIQENIVATKRMAQARLIVEFMSAMIPSMIERIEKDSQYFYEIRESNDQITEEGQAIVCKKASTETWTGRLNAIKIYIGETEKNIEKKVEKEIKDVEKNIEKKFEDLVEKTEKKDKKIEELEMRMDKKLKDVSERTQSMDKKLEDVSDQLTSVQEDLKLLLSKLN